MNNSDHTFKVLTFSVNNSVIKCPYYPIAKLISKNQIDLYK